ERMKALGVDGMFSNYPDMLAEEPNPHTKQESAKGTNREFLVKARKALDELVAIRDTIAKKPEAAASSPVKAAISAEDRDDFKALSDMGLITDMGEGRYLVSASTIRPGGAFTGYSYTGKKEALLGARRLIVLSGKEIRLAELQIKEFEDLYAYLRPLGMVGGIPAHNTIQLIKKLVLDYKKSPNPNLLAEDGPIMITITRAKGTPAEGLRTKVRELLLSSASSPVEANIVHRYLLANYLSLAITRQETDPYWKSQALANLVPILAQQGRTDEALKALNEALTIARQEITNPHWKSRALANLVPILAQQGRTDEALKALNEALTIARQEITNPHWKSQALANLVPILAQLGRINWSGTEVKQAQAELDETLQAISKATNLKIDKIIEPLLVFMTASGLSLDAIKEKRIWNRFIRFINQAGANIVNNTQFLREMKVRFVEEQFDTISNYFVSFEISLYLLKLFTAFTNSATPQDRAALVSNFKDYYSVFIQGREPDNTLLNNELIEEIHYASIGSTNLDRQTYRSTLARFKDEQIPVPNLSTGFKLRVASGELVVLGVTEEEEGFIHQRLQYLKGISQRAPPEFIADILSNLYTTYLKSDPATLPEHIRELGLALRADPSIGAQLNAARVNVASLQQAIATHLSKTKHAFDYAAILKDIIAISQQRPGQA
ncbi:MAG: tetratricopeptide repeat protein, partial [Candidatus Desantisbacteria bacterium]